IMESMRVSVNLLGNCVATMVVARWEGQLDSDRMSKVLRGEDVAPLEDTDAEPQKEVVAAA
ncbi:MAG: aerobic C4-dicarboxylate transport protein, partial [Mycobacterium sp.]|nr:aerobic C4-dicarboxylate transport protein [Mycobacterium sp.]